MENMPHGQVSARRVMGGPRRRPPPRAWRPALRAVSPRLSDAFYRPAYEQIVSWLDIKPGTSALEAGAGAGGFTEILAEAVGSEGKVVALDQSPELLRTVGERLNGLLAERVSHR